MFADKLKKIREEKNLSQADLGKILHVSRSAVAKWEQGRGIPSKESVHDLSRYFGIPEADFFSTEEACDAYQKSEKRHRHTLIWIWSLVGALSCSTIGIGVYWGVASREKKAKEEELYRIQEQQFFPAEKLAQSHLESLQPIEGHTYVPFMLMGCYHSYVDYGVFDRYAKYVFETLSYSPYLSYLSFLIDRPFAAYHQVSKKQYLVPASDYHDGYSTNLSMSYTFAYLASKPAEDHKSGDSVACTIVTMTFDPFDCYAGYWSDDAPEGEKVTDKHYYNFSMYFKTIPLKGDGFYTYYLLTELYDFEKKTVTADNFSTFFTPHFHHEYQDAYLSFEPTSYFIHAYIPLTASLRYRKMDEDANVAYHEEISSHIIESPYNWTTVFFFMKASAEAQSFATKDNPSYLVDEGNIFFVTEKE